MKQWVQDFQKKGRKRGGGFESPLDHEMTVRDTDSRGILRNSYGVGGKGYHLKAEPQPDRWKAARGWEQFHVRVEKGCSYEHHFIKVEEE